MQSSALKVYIFAFWAVLSSIIVAAQDGEDLLPGDENGWQSMEGVDAWYLPSEVESGGVKDGSVYFKESKNRVRCGVVPYDAENKIWMIPAQHNFEDVGYILPRGGYDYRYDSTLADCVLREAAEEGGLIIDINSLIPLGRSNKGAVYWYRGSVTENVDPTEPRPQLPESFALSDAAAELQKPPNNAEKKSAMRKALASAQLADQSKSYQSTFKPRGGLLENAAYIVQDSAQGKIIYTQGYKDGKEALVRVEIDPFSYKITAKEAWNAYDQTPVPVSLNRILMALWKDSGLSSDELVSVEFSPIVDSDTEGSIAIAREKLKLDSNEPRRITNEPDEQDAWDVLVHSNLGEIALAMAHKTKKSITAISFVSSKVGHLTFEFA